MTDPNKERAGDPQVSQRYRELGAEEPPRALDDAILAAARRAAGSRPAPLAAPTGRGRWFAPLAAAAVLVLAVSVTLHMQLEQPDAESPSPRADPSPPPPKISAPEARPQTKSAAVTGEEERRAGRQAIAEAPRASEPKPFLEDKLAAASPAEAGPLAARPAPASAPAAVLSSRSDQARAEAVSAPQAGALQPLAKRAVTQANVQTETPERELERIAELRRQGKHDEADKALAEFRKRYPDYRIPEAVRERVERR